MTTSYRGAQTLIKKGDEAGLRTALEGNLSSNSSNDNGWSLLMLAAVEGDVAIGQLLIDKGANMAAMNKKGDTAESIARSRGHEAFVALLK